MAQLASFEPWQRRSISTPALARGGPLGYDLESTPLAKRLIPNIHSYLETNDLNEVARRALVHVLAIRSWQLRHDGRFPDRLEALVPEELPSRPLDPFSGRPFGYLSREESIRTGHLESLPSELPPESRLLYSVGPN